VSEERLPAKIRVAAKNLFARLTGMSSREIVEFFIRYSDGIPEYPWQPDAGYRADYLYGCLDRLPVSLQRQALLALCDYSGPMSYGSPPPAGVEELRRWLHEGEAPVHDAEGLLEQIDWPYVQRQWGKALGVVDPDPEAAVSTARSLIETVCKHILDERRVDYDNDGDMTALYKRCVQSLDFSGNVKAASCLKQMTGGTFGVVGGLAGLRNEQGDSHGKGKDYIGPEPRHARFAVNAAAALATFLIESHQATA